MNRVAVIGPPGAGKTEFANKLGEVLEIDSVIHLDHYLWKPGWIRTTTEERLSIIKDITEMPNWVIEGNYLDIIDEQISRATLVVWLNVGPYTSLYRVITRYLRRLAAKGPDEVPGITLSFIWSIILYPFVDQKVIRKKIENQSGLSAVILNSPDQIASYLEKIRQ